MNSQRVLVIRLSAIGDVIRTLPAVKALKESAPSSYIAWVVEEPSKTILESQPEIDEVILFPRKRLERGLKSPLRWWTVPKELATFVKGLRKRRFDVVLDFHGLLKSGLISLVSGAPKRIGFDRRSTKEGNSFFSTVKVDLPREKVNRFDRNLALLRGLGLEINNVRPVLHIPSKELEWADIFFEQLPYPLPKPLVAIHPGTSSRTPYKRWLPERYSHLADRLIRELGAGILFTWGPDELEWVEKIRSQMVGPSFVAPRTDSLTQLGGIFRRCDLYIGGDTGPLHVASFVGTPVVAIFGPTHPVVNEPVGLHRMIRKEVGCNPCRKYFCEELTCMKSVTVDDVFDAAREILNEKARIERSI
jgi:heptosyltransferase I